MKEEVNIFKIKYNLLAKQTNKQTNKQTKTCKTLNYIEPWFILASTFTYCV